MTIPRSAADIAASAQLACLLEASAPKPGNVSPRRPFADLTYEDFLVSAVAICGLPPLNGLVSELLVYLGLLRVALAPGSAWAALAVPLLAATGGLAVACFVKVFGIVFLGVPRTPAAAHGAPSSTAPAHRCGCSSNVIVVAPTCRRTRPFRRSRSIASCARRSARSFESPCLYDS